METKVVVGLYLKSEKVVAMSPIINKKLTSSTTYLRRSSNLSFKVQSQLSNSLAFL